MAIEIGTFDFNYCPECGSTDLQGWVFKCVLVGQIRECKSCGKEWHVIWENEDDWEDPDYE